MFERVGGPSDGTGASAEGTCRGKRVASAEPVRPREPGRLRGIAPSEPRARDYRPDPSDDHTSILVRIRATTSSVNSVVPAWPPRSVVLTPAPTVSSAASYTAR